MPLFKFRAGKPMGEKERENKKKTSKGLRQRKKSKKGLFEVFYVPDCRL